MSTMEIQKTHPAEFGGLQAGQLTAEEIENRYCAAANCGFAGWGQVQVALTEPAEYRVLCRVHYVLNYFLQLGLLGDPDYRFEAIRVTRAAGLTAAGLLDVDRALPSAPEDWTCARCGGNMVKLDKVWEHYCNA